MAIKAPIPSDIEAILKALDAATSGVEQLFSIHDSGTIARPPGPGRWSAAQCVAHLAVTNLAYLSAMRAAVQPVLHLYNHERGGPIHPGLFANWFLPRLEPPVSRRRRAPRRLSPPAATEPRVALREFQHSQTAVRELLLECRHLDLNRIRCPNPLVPGLRFTVGAAFLIIAAHERRHLWQATMATIET